MKTYLVSLMFIFFISTVETNHVIGQSTPCPGHESYSDYPDNAVLSMFAYRQHPTTSGQFCDANTLCKPVLRYVYQFPGSESSSATCESGWYGGNSSHFNAKVTLTNNYEFYKDDIFQTTVQRIHRFENGVTPTLSEGPFNPQVPDCVKFKDIIVDDLGLAAGDYEIKLRSKVSLKVLVEGVYLEVCDANMNCFSGTVSGVPPVTILNGTELVIDDFDQVTIGKPKLSAVSNGCYREGSIISVFVEGETIPFNNFNFDWDKFPNHNSNTVVCTCIPHHNVVVTDLNNSCTSDIDIQVYNCLGTGPPVFSKIDDIDLEIGVLENSLQLSSDIIFDSEISASIMSIDGKLLLSEKFDFDGFHNLLISTISDRAESMYILTLDIIEKGHTDPIRITKKLIF